MSYDILGVRIENVQMEQLEILREFDKICQQHDIQYQLMAGTLLGAVRHQGFIPWDDDIDVCLLRSDYNRFIEICQEELNDSFFLQTYETDNNYIMQFAKIRKNNTLFVEDSTSELNIHHGIYIDVFPLDNIEPETFQGALQQKGLYLLGRINLLRIKKLCLNNNPFLRAAYLFGHYLVRLIPDVWINKAQTNISCIFQQKETRFVTHLTNGASKDRYVRYMMEEKDFFDTIDGEFEGYSFPIPRNYDAVLSRLFGDYMKLPPKEQQKPHHGIIKVQLISQI